MKSPCINVCVMDEGSGQCRGCFRTLAEIARWGGTTDEDRNAILGAVGRRREAAGAAAPDLG